MTTLSEIQSKLNAPKGQYNTFGKYSYRSCEDILSAAKPLLGGNAITITDEIVLVGDRYYVKATATLLCESGDVSVTAYAREAETKKGMDPSQITGAASSYARKYALNGLFAIDDTKDADTKKPVEEDTSGTFEPMIDKAKSPDDVNKIWEKNRTRITAMPESEQEKLIGYCKDIKAILTKDAEGK